MGHDEDGSRFPWWLGVVGGVFLLIAVALIAASMRDRTPPTFRPVPAGDTAVADSGGTRRVTLDARDPDRWVYFDASTGRVLERATEGWDMAARRFHLIVNGGDALPGSGAATSTRHASLADIHRPPDDGWVVTERDGDGELRHPLLEDWYEYDFFSHLLTPARRTYVLRTAEGRLLKVRFLSYYCPGPEGGCVTLRYAPFGGDRRARTGEPKPARQPRALGPERRAEEETTP